MRQSSGQERRVVIDTNVLVSAFCFGGKPGLVLDKVVDGQYALFSSFEQWSELVRVLAYPQLRRTRQEREHILRILSTMVVMVDPKERINIVKEDLSDNVLLEIASECQAEFLISGDAHLLKLKQFRSTKIVSPADFLK